MTYHLRNAACGVSYQLRRRLGSYDYAVARLAELARRPDQMAAAGPTPAPVPA